jgi:hypothetical protein
MHLLDLIDDPNNEIVEHVCEKIIAQGEAVIPELEYYLHHKTFGQNEISTLNRIIQEVQFNVIQKQLKEWKTGTEKELLEGLYILTKFQYPELKIEELKDAIDYYKKDIWLEINPKLTNFELIKTFNQVFFNYFNFGIIPLKNTTPFDFFLPSIFPLKRFNILFVKRIVWSWFACNTAPNTNPSSWCSFARVCNAFKSLGKQLPPNPSPGFKK